MKIHRNLKIGIVRSERLWFFPHPSDDSQNTGPSFMLSFADTERDMADLRSQNETGHPFSLFVAYLG
jgi:hypothetical protein